MRLTDLRFFDRAPNQSFKGTIKKWIMLVMLRLRKWDIDRDGRRLLDMMIGEAGPRSLIKNLASNKRARRTVAGVVARELARLVEADPSLRVRHLTIVHDGWATTDRQTIIELGDAKWIVHQLLAPAKLAGWFSTFEIQPVANHERSVGRKLYGHVHVIILTRDPSFDFDALEKRLLASQRLVCALGAPTAVITGEGFDQMPLDQKLKLVRTWAWYFFKAPAHAQNLVPSRDQPGKSRTYGKDVRPDLALRLFEILSRMTLEEIMSASGEGKAIMSVIKGKLPGAWKRLDAEQLDRQIADFWSHARRLNKRQQYAPVRINKMKNGQRPKASIRGSYKKAALASAEGQPTQAAAAGKRLGFADDYVHPVYPDDTW